MIDLGDAICGINYLFKGWPPPDPVCLLDVTCDSEVNVGDVVYLLNYLFKGDDPPCPDCCAGKSKMDVSPGQSIKTNPVRQESTLPQIQVGPKKHKRAD
jgi:hypothetical protein